MTILEAVNLMKINLDRVKKVKTPKGKTIPRTKWGKTEYTVGLTFQYISKKGDNQTYRVKPCFVCDTQPALFSVETVMIERSYTVVGREVHSTKTLDDDEFPFLLCYDCYKKWEECYEKWMKYYRENWKE